MKLLKGLLIVFVLIYSILLAGLYLFQEQLIFRPEKIDKNYTETAIQGLRFDAYEEFYLAHENGLRINAQLIKTRFPKRGIIYFLHGNQGNIFSQKINNPFFLDRGYDIFMIDYQGYGKSDGVASERALQEDAVLGYDFLKERYPTSEIIIHGHSLGSVPSLYLSTVRPAKFLLLSAPIYTVKDILNKKMPYLWLPFDFKTNFDNTPYIAQIDHSVYIAHAINDGIIPFESTQNFKQLLRPKDSFTAVSYGGHNALSRGKEYTALVNQLFGELMID